MLAAVAVAAVALAGAPTSGTETIGCRDQSSAGFPGAFSARANLVVGPLSFVGLHQMRGATPENIAQHGGWKSPALVRPGHTITVSIDREARGFARLRYSHHGERPFGRLPHTVRYVACDEAHAGSTVDGRPVTFWSGFFELRKAPACVPVTITVDRRAPRHRRLSVANGACGAGPGASMRT